MAIASRVTTTTVLHQDNEGDELLDAAEAKQFCILAAGLLWLAHCTRQDIAFAVHQITRRTHIHRVADMRLGTRVSCYLIGTTSVKLCIGFQYSLLKC